MKTQIAKFQKRVNLVTATLTILIVLSTPSITFATIKNLNKTVKGVGLLLARCGSSLQRGTAFVVNKNGYLVTNAHVLMQGEKKCDEFVVYFSPNIEVEVKIETIDKGKDLAIVKAVGKFDIDPLIISTDDPAQGEDIFVCGFPGAASLIKGENSLKDCVLCIQSPKGKDCKKLCKDTLNPKITKGIVSSLASCTNQPMCKNIDKVVQTDASINPGNSGGPMLNECGRVVAVATFYIKRMFAQGFNYGIDVRDLKLFLKKNAIKFQSASGKCPLIVKSSPKKNKKNIIKSKITKINSEAKKGKSEIKTKQTREERKWESIIIIVLILSSVVLLTLAAFLLIKKKKKSPPAKKKLPINSTSDESSKYILYSMNGCFEGSEFPLINKTIVMGRDHQGCNIVFQESSKISKKHLEIRVSDSTLLVKDLYSTNGSRLNGKELIPGKLVTLKIGSIIEIGGNKFVIKERTNG